MIKILDYGVGNIQSFINCYHRQGIKLERALKSQDLDNASHIILPGVGNFDFAMKQFNTSGLRDKTEELVLGAKIPVIGICVGYQMMGMKSEEGIENGLGWLNGETIKFKLDMGKEQRILPHMGWNHVNYNDDEKIFQNILPTQSEFYFLHSFHFLNHQKETVVGTTEYGYKFSSVSKQDNIIGVQFHPEKSHIQGELLLKNFFEIKTNA